MSDQPNQPNKKEEDDLSQKRPIPQSSPVPKKEAEKPQKPQKPQKPEETTHKPVGQPEPPNESAAAGKPKKTQDPKKLGDAKTADSYTEHAKFWAKSIRSGGNFSHTHIEKPVMYGRMKQLAPGASVLAVGCGSGEECNDIKKLGAARVVGTDISEGLIQEAKAAFSDIEFQVAAAEDHSMFEDNSIDVIYSSLAMHYIKHWAPVLKDFYRILKPGGTFLFSVIHPLHWGMELVRPKGSRVTNILYGYTTSPDSQQVRIYGDYLNHYTKHDRFLGKIQVTYYHRPISQMWRDITSAGFKIVDIIEPKSVQEDVPKNFEGFAKVTQKIPYFLIFELKKTDQPSDDTANSSTE